MSTDKDFENGIWIRIIGNGGYKNGVVCDEWVTFEELSRMDSPASTIMERINAAMKTIRDYELSKATITNWK